jgi:hypothetical protein
MSLSNAQAITYLNFVNSAYLMYGQDGHDLRPPAIDIPPGYAITAYMSSIDPESGKRVFFGFLAGSPNLQAPAILAIRGTYNFSEWLSDADLLPVAFPPYSNDQSTAYVETGFYEFYQGIAWLPPHGSGADFMSTLDAVGTNHQGIVIVGHSLGGSMGTLVAADLSVSAPNLKVQLVTAASPATGDETFAGMFNAMVPNSYRYINDFDTVASFLDGLYTQVDTGIQLYSFDIYPTPECEHSLFTYIYLLSPDGTPCTTDCCIVSGDSETRSQVRLLHAMRQRRLVALRERPLD